MRNCRLCERRSLSSLNRNSALRVPGWRSFRGWCLKIGTATAWWTPADSAEQVGQFGGPGECRPVRVELALLGKDAFPGKGKSRDQELAELKRELAKVKKERDFLKEAATYFAKQSK